MRQITAVIYSLTGLLALFSFLPATCPRVETFQQAGLQASIQRGKIIYAGIGQCLSCHQADGGGVENMNPPLVKTSWVLGDKTKLITVVLKGLTGQNEINGDSYHNVMASHSELSDLQIADVLTYVRNSFGNKASLVTPAQVKSVRAKTK